MRTSLTRALAGTAIAATAVFTAAGIASASTPPKAPTSLSIAASATTITVGSKVTVSGQLTSGTTPLAKHWVPVAERPTGAAGNVAFVREPGTTVSFRLDYLGTTKYAPSHSAVVTVTVKPKTPTALGIGSFPGTIKPGQTDTIRGLLTADKAPLAGKRVWLERWNGATKKWVALTAVATGKFGRVAFFVKPKVTTIYKLAFFGNATYAASHSSPVAVVVK
jgi:hypothetical protein